jgi:hypothetical protein
MMSLEVIEELAHEAGVVAAEEERTPFVVWPEDIERMPPFPFPNLGDYVPEGWELVEEYFCDMTGYDACGPAMSVNGLLREIKRVSEKNGYKFGYAVTRTGQFQCYVGRFKEV